MKIGIVATEDFEETTEARATLEYMANCDCDVKVFTQGGKLPAYFYQKYAKNLSHEHMRIFAFLGFIGRWITSAWTMFMLWRSKLDKVYMFVGNKTNVALANAVFSFCVARNIQLVLRVAKDVRHSADLAAFVSEFHEYQKYEVIQTAGRSKQPQTNIGEAQSLHTLVFSDADEMRQILNELKMESEIAPNFFVLQDEMVALYNQSNRETLLRHQAALFNHLYLAQPEQISIGTRNQFFALVKKQQAQEERKEAQQPAEEEFELIKNPNPPVLVVCPISTKADNNDFTAIRDFAEALEKYAKKVATANKPIDIKLVITMPPMRKQRNDALFKLVKGTTNYVNKLIDRSGAEFVHAYMLQLANHDFEALVKAASFALVSRQTPESAGRITAKMNSFCCPCIVLNEAEVEDPTRTPNLKTNEKESYAAFYQMMLEAREQFVGNCVPASNSWSI